VGVTVVAFLRNEEEVPELQHVVVFGVEADRIDEVRSELGELFQTDMRVTVQDAVHLDVDLRDPLLAVAQVGDGFFSTRSRSPPRRILA
jgi:hypothetical protein